MKQFNDDEVNVLRGMIHEHENGLSADYREHFAPRQKPLTYRELEVVRQLITERDRVKVNIGAAEAGMKLADNAVKAIAEIANLQPPKTSRLLEDAANLLQDMAYVTNSQGDKPPMLGQDWLKLVTQLRDRARQFRDMES